MDLLLCSLDGGFQTPAPWASPSLPASRDGPQSSDTRICVSVRIFLRFRNSSNLDPLAIFRCSPEIILS